ncbi:MAG: energy transducer TonB [Candidatus Acidiferrales bacterium]
MVAPLGLTIRIASAPIEAAARHTVTLTDAADFDFVAADFSPPFLCFRDCDNPRPSSYNLPDAAAEANMRKNLTRALAAILLIYAALAGAQSKTSAAPHFLPPDITSATDVAYPINTLAAGLVSLEVNLTAAGQVENLKVVRDIPGLTARAISAVTSWTFTPAKLDGQAVESSINVHVVFNPGTPQNQNLQLTPGAPVPQPNPPGYLPPTLSQISDATYPPNSIAQGAVVLDLRIDKSGQIKKITTIRAIPSLTVAAIAAAKTWSVNPAKLNDNAEPAHVALAFVFRSPTISNP